MFHRTHRSETQKLGKIFESHLSSLEARFSETDYQQGYSSCLRNIFK